ncbi:5'-nucleotidase [Streptomyces sp. NBC_00237]|uniref:5'-nucleotidase n=1 Tax=Streptomyces sp. NBC_00237 TaxID=2975687 RepID=UPI0022550CF0|nr:5'-nucleotidase [Streptomyces sp. NBC_00237]MCX5200273.1 5'-nucleotidase [Streptomyces sp. NBC_00237]
MLRSGLAVAFSAGVILGAIAPLDIAWSTGKDGAGAAVALPGDIAWFKAPSKPGVQAAQPSDIAWDAEAQPSDIAWFGAGDIAWNSAPAGKVV